MKLHFGILGLNARNLLYIKKFNPKKQIHFVTNKYKTKEFLSFRGIPVPKTICYIRNKQDLFDLDFSTFLEKSFVVKPNKGSGGKGIFIIKDMRPHLVNDKLSICGKGFGMFIKKTSKKDFFFKIYNYLCKILTYLKQIKFINNIFVFLSDYFFSEKNIKVDLLVGGEWISDKDLKKTLLPILDGAYRIGDNPDKILIEEILKPNENYKCFCKYGLADIRVVSCNLVPVAAMIRIPTKESGGKANLAQGGIACGINIVTGIIETFFTGKGGKLYTKKFPKKYEHLKGKQIDFRDEIIQYSSNAQYFLNIGYMGIDWVITETGPKVLEINGRSGIEIQNITQIPLRNIMDKIQDLKINSPSKGVEISKSLFSSEETISKEQVIYLSQPANISWKEGDVIKVLDLIAIVNTKNQRNYLSPKLYGKLGGKKSVKLHLPDSKINVDIKIYKSDKIKGNKLILGTDFLHNYLIKPIEKTSSNIESFGTKKIYSSELDELQLFDQHIFNLQRKLNLQVCLKPLNYLEELDVFIQKKGKYNPKFNYKYPTIERINYLERELDILQKKQSDRESPFAKLLKDKLEELNNKLGLIVAYKYQNLDDILKYNQKLFGEISSDIYEQSIIKCSLKKNIKKSLFGEELSFYEIYHRVKKYLEEKKINLNIETSSTMLSRISIGYKNGEAYLKLLASSRNKMKRIELESKLVHEIDVHFKRFYNGRKSGWFLLQQGTAGYITDEEGLAIFQAEKRMQEFISEYKNINIRRNYLYLRQAQFSNFRDLGEFINKYENYNYNGNKNKYMNLFNRILKFKKGICDTKNIHPGSVYYKDKVYLDGYLKINKYIDNGGDLEKLMIGKIKIEDLKFIL